MKYRNHNKKRDANEREIVDALVKAGATVARLDQPVDLLVGFRGQTFLLEVKNPNGKNRLQKSQVEFLDTWNGAPVAIVHDTGEALTAIGLVNSGLQVMTRAL